jgi:hypothetical protein
MTSSAKQQWARGGTIFAATLLMVVGAFQFFQGIAAIAKGDFFVAGPNYLYSTSVTAWGWIHLIIGALVAVTGYFVYTGAEWARGAGIALAAFSALSQFFFLPFYPVWSLVIIAIDVWVIWALCTVDPHQMHEAAMLHHHGNGHDHDHDHVTQHDPT